MRLRKSNKQGKKIAPAMAPMIDIVFLLLVFFMLTLKIVPPEGNFTINMPLDGHVPPRNIPELKVRLIADEVTGELVDLKFGKRSLGNDPETVFAELNAQILHIIGRPGNPLAKELAVEIEADYNLHYKYAVKTVSACRGRLDDTTGEVVPYIQNVKLVPPRKLPRS